MIVIEINMANVEVAYPVSTCIYTSLIIYSLHEPTIYSKIGIQDDWWIGLATVRCLAAVQSCITGFWTFNGKDSVVSPR